MEPDFQPTAFEERLNGGGCGLNHYEEYNLKSISQDVGLLQLCPYSLAIVISQLQLRIEDLESELRELKERPQDHAY